MISTAHGCYVSLTPFRLCAKLVVFWQAENMAGRMQNWSAADTTFLLEMLKDVTASSTTIPVKLDNLLIYSD